MAAAATAPGAPVRVITARAVGFLLAGVALFDGAGLRAHQLPRAGG